MTRLGVAGLGWLGESLIKDVPRVAGLEVVAVQDVVGERAAALAEQYGVRWYGQRYEDLLARADVDAVMICTPNGLHAAQAQLALLAGKDVLVQKPLAVSFGEALDTIDVARDTERLLFVDYTYRFLETMSALRSALASSGTPKRVRATFHNIYGPGAEKAWFLDPSLSGGGALTDLGVHLLDLGLWLLEPNSVRVETVALSDTRPVEHAATVALRLDDIPFEVAVSWNAPLPATDITLEIETAQTVLRWENVDGSFFHFRSLKDGEVLLDRETTLREDTLRAFAAAVATREGPRIDARVYAILDQAYGRDAPIVAR